MVNLRLLFVYKRHEVHLSIFLCTPVSCWVCFGQNEESGEQRPSPQGSPAGILLPAEVLRRKVEVMQRGPVEALQRSASHYYSFLPAGPLCRFYAGCCGGFIDAAVILIILFLKKLIYY